MKNANKCTACGVTPAQTYDIGIFMGNWARKGRYCMTCLAAVYARRPANEEK